MFEHLRRSFNHVVENLGPHSLPLIGHADWNDCLNLNCFSTDPDESFQTSISRDGRTAESVMIAAMFVLIGEDFAESARRTGRGDMAKETEARDAGNARRYNCARLGRPVVPARLRQLRRQGGVPRHHGRADLPSSRTPGAPWQGWERTRATR